MALTSSLYLAQQLLKIKSITPKSDNVMFFIKEYLERLNFAATLKEFGQGLNLYATLGEGAPHLCFSGHCDVVPVGDESTWKYPPFEGFSDSEYLYGRGAVDMKGAIACFLSAIESFIKEFKNFEGTLSVLLTCDEEATSEYGMVPMLEWLSQQDQFKDRENLFDACIVGEPTNPEKVGDMVKVGRRGSLTTTIVVNGVMGHVAYPSQAHNPIPSLVRFLNVLQNHSFDEGTDIFDPTHLEITTIDVGNPTANIIPAKAVAQFNIRYNSLHTFESLEVFIHKVAKKEIDTAYELAFLRNGEAFFCQDPSLEKLVCESIKKITGSAPVVSTSGGTSDARFLKNYTPVIEFGLCNATAHKIDERVSICDLKMLTEIYTQIIKDYFATN